MCVLDDDFNVADKKTTLEVVWTAEESSDRSYHVILRREGLSTMILFGIFCSHVFIVDLI
jgi:hypothetical protein